MNSAFSYLSWTLIMDDSFKLVKTWYSTYHSGAMENYIYKKSNSCSFEAFDKNRKNKVK